MSNKSPFKEMKYDLESGRQRAWGRVRAMQSVRGRDGLGCVAEVGRAEGLSGER